MTNRSSFQRELFVTIWFFRLVFLTIWGAASIHLHLKVGIRAKVSSTCFDASMRSLYQVFPLALHPGVREEIEKHALMSLLSCIRTRRASFGFTSNWKPATERRHEWRELSVHRCAKKIIIINSVQSWALAFWRQANRSENGPQLHRNNNINNKFCRKIQKTHAYIGFPSVATKRLDPDDENIVHKSCRQRRKPSRPSENRLLAVDTEE